jgi:hypothetical protein
MVCNCWVYPFLCPSHPTEKCIASSLIIYFGMKPPRTLLQTFTPFYQRFEGVKQPF